MPIHSWNWFRAVGVGNDLKSWYGDNPQVEDGREGGNVDFDDDVSGQYEDEVNFMMRRLRLNFYRAEDMMLIYKRKQWAVRYIQKIKIFGANQKYFDKYLLFLLLLQNVSIHGFMISGGG